MSRADQVTEGTGAWPTRGPDFNRWNADAAAFVRLVQDNPGFWLRDFQLKYLTVHIDTRDGGFVLKDRDSNVIEAGRVVAAIEAYRGGWSRSETPIPALSQSGEA